MRSFDAPDILFGLGVTILLLGSLGIFSDKSTRVEAQSPQTLQIQRRIDLTNYSTLSVICDKANGYLYIALHTGSTNGGVSLETIPNGCSRSN